MAKRSNTYWLIRFNEDVASCSSEAGRVNLEIKNWRTLQLAPEHPEVAERLAGELPEGGTLSELNDGLSDAAMAEMDFLLDRFQRLRVLEWAVIDEGREIAVLRSLSASYRLDHGAVAPAACGLSRFAYLRHLPAEDAAGRSSAVIESGGSRARLHLAPRASALLAPLASEPRRSDEHALFDLARRAGLLDPVDAEEPENRVPWEFHDRLFHQISRGFDETTPIGGTYRLRDRLASPPAVTALPPGPVIALPRPEAEEGHSLSDVMTRRHSTRHYAEAPIDLTELSTLLSRTLRNRGHLQNGSQDTVQRPYPAGGGLHELEFYLLANHCEGLERGLYRYLGEDHALCRISQSQGALNRMLERSAAAMGDPSVQPQVLLIITTRHARLAWKYQGIAYRLSLMHTGVVLQTLYLVATDLGLAACANGAGASRAFEEASGLDPWEEMALGEFALGRAA